MAVRDDVRSGNTQSSTNTESRYILLVLTGIFGAVMGYQEDSWWVFLGLFLGSFWLMGFACAHNLPTIMWAIVVGVIGVDWTWGLTEWLSQAGRISVAALVFLFCAGATLGGLQAINDNLEHPDQSPIGEFGNSIMQAIGLIAILYVNFHGVPF